MKAGGAHASTCAQSADPFPTHQDKDTLPAMRLLIVLLVAAATGCSSSGSLSGQTTAPATASAVPATSPAAVDPSTQFEKAVRDKLGKGNRSGIPRVTTATFNNGKAEVRFAINDNLTNGLIKSGANADGLAIIAIAKTLPGLTELSITGTFSMKNNLGEVSEQEVLRGVYSSDVVSRINPETIDRAKVFQVADVSSFTHPAFRA